MFDTIGDKERVKTLISDFKCSRNEDLEDFLLNSSIRMEEADKTRTFLVLEEGKIYNDNEKFRILGYFSLGNKAVQIAGKLSKSKIQKLDGMSKEVEIIECYLIGQLGKNEIYESDIDGKTILDNAMDMIELAKSVVGRRVVLVESVDNKKVLKFYNDNGFTKIDEMEVDNKKTGKKEKLHQLIKRI